jgi:acyl carrier protein
MTVQSRDEIRETLLRLLGEVAPEADLASLDSATRIRDQIDIDSMDALNFLIGIDAALGVDIPESDYPRLATLDSIIAYVEERLTAQGRR